MVSSHLTFLFFFFNDTATTEIYTLSLHDALPIWYCRQLSLHQIAYQIHQRLAVRDMPRAAMTARSEEHTSELQSQSNLVCRLLLEKKKTRVTVNNLSPSQMTRRYLNFYRVPQPSH